MPKKDWSDEDRKAFGEKMRQARLKKQEDKEEKKEVAESTREESLDEKVARLVAEQLRAEKEKGNGSTAGISPERGVKTLGSLDKDDYENPVPRLLSLDELKKFAMSENYVLKWDVELVEFEKYNTWFRLPRFKVELFRHPTDGEIAEAEEKGDKRLKPDSLIFVSRHYQHDDDIAARQAATRLGMEIGRDFADVEQMMDEMRFHRIKTWLVDTFNPPKLTAENKKSEMAIGGRLVEVAESEQILR